MTEESGHASERPDSPSLITLLWWIRMLRIEESRLEFICKSALCWQFKPKGPIVPLFIPPTFSLNISFSHPLHSLVFHIVFLAFVLPLLSFSLITLYLPFSTHRLCLPSLWRLFISLIHIATTVLIQGDLFLFRCQAFVE